MLALLGLGIALIGGGSGLLVGFLLTGGATKAANRGDAQRA
jgi:hypothetical protein